jgi:hypothetical protein
MALNPFEDSRQKVRDSTGEFSLGLARVTASPDDSNHRIGIRPVTQTGANETITNPTGADVLVSEFGDVNVPQRGDMVVFGRFENRNPVVLGTIYTQESAAREYDSTERHIGRESSAGLFLHGPFGVVPRRTEAPENPPDGAIWYREDLDEYRGVENGTKVSFDTTTV